MHKKQIHTLKMEERKEGKKERRKEDNCESMSKNK
jgi:hypothetical protein